jgi:4-methylaminobutanoate oxidase (formaldehyde-forming)
VARLAPDRVYLVTGTGFATHDFSWIQRQLPELGDVRLEDHTEELAVLALMGPRAREVLSEAASGDVSGAAFPFGSVRELAVAGHPVRALRITYVGELGWELHMAREDALDCYQALMAAGARHGIANAGYRAIESLRLEKAYRAWGADLTPSHTPLEAGLGWATKLATGSDFLGREALETQRRRGLARRLAIFQVQDPAVVLLGRETLYRNGERVGWLTSGGFGHTLGRGVGMGYVEGEAPLDAAFLREGSYELEVATERVAATLHLRPLYDPDGVRIRT